MARYGSLHEGLPAGKVVGFSGITIGFLAAMVGALAQGAFGQDTLTTWPYNTPITLNTSATGASVTTKQSNFPVLVRLTSANAAAVFAGAQANGADLRFSRSATDTAQFPYQISKYNQATQTAYIWVAPDTVGGSNASQSVQMWWGKGAAAAKSNGPAVFAPANGFVAVWHLDSAGVAGNGKPTFNDATGNGYMDTGTTTIVDSPSVILDSARAFNKWLLPSTAGGQGDSIYINSLLGSPGNGAGHAVTFSAWVKADSLDQSSHKTTVASLGNDFSVEVNSNGTANVYDTLHCAYRASTNWNLQPVYTMGAIHPPAWKHIAMIINSASSTADTCAVYVNGALGQALGTTNATSGVMVYQTGANLSTYMVLGADDGNTGRTAFFGEIGEARVENVRRSPDWLKLSYQNEQGVDALTSLSAVGPAAPALSQPANMAVGQAVNLSLSWNSSALASAYSVQVSTDVNFGSTVFQQSGLAVTSAAPTGLANGTWYYWRANATNGSYTSSWSGAWSFLTIALFGAPPLVTPTNSAINQSTAPTVTWGAVSGATTYWLQVSTESGFVTPIFNSSTLTSTSQSLSGLSNYTTYYWEVNANNGSTYGGWSSLWSFTTVIAMPVLSSPSSGAVNQPVTLTLNWGAVPGAASYSLEVSSSATFAGAPAVNLSGITNLSQAVSGLATSTTYYWEVSATGGNGGTGAWSASWSFTTVPPVPGVPALSVPANGASGQPLSPNLTWGTVANAASYEVQVSLSSGFSSKILDQSGLTVTSQTIGPLGFATAYYWRVSAANIGGASAWSGVYAFSTVENYNLWSNHVPIGLNTTSGGANVSTTVYNFPVLIRLTSSNFSGFGSVQAGGADIRFSKSADYTMAFPYQIQRWNAANDLAEIWVLLDTVLGNSSTQTITMHYGNGGAASLSSGPAVFSPSNNFVAVWHLQDLTDATGNGHTLYDTLSAAPKVSAVIDSGYSFNGTISQHLNCTGVMGSPATLTLSCWATTAVTTQADFVSISNDAALESNASGANCLFYENTATNWVSFSNTAASVLSGKGWTYVTGVINPSASFQGYYENGAIVTGLTSANGCGTSSVAIDYVQTPSTTGVGYNPNNGRYFNGSLNEVRIENTARSAPWIALCYANQQTSQTLLNFNMLPSVPTLSSPTNNAVGQSTALTLVWNSASGALTYEVQVATAAGFGAAIVSDQAGIGVLTAAPAGLAGGATYFWRVDATNGNGTTAWSSVWSFSTLAPWGAPVPFLPANNAINQPTSPTLSWSAVSGAQSYGIQVSLATTFASTIVGQTGLTGVSQALTGLSNYTTYYWEVNAYDGISLTTPWSTMDSFTTIIASPVLSGPSNGAVNQPVSLSLNWGAVAGANAYALMVSTSSAFGTTAFSQTGISGTSQAVSGLALLTTYYWEVSATGGNGGTGAWSTAWSFTTVPPAPGVPVLSTPANGASNQPLSPTLTWGTVATAISYEAQVSLSSGFSSTVLDQPGITATSQAIGPLVSATTYYWRVNAANGGGVGAWSGVYSFTTVENYATWSYHMPMGLNTSATGANVANNVYNFPVLVRLTSSNFSGFGLVQAGGADIRFSKTDYTKPFPYQIQRWDVTDNLAEIWVLLDTVYGNSSTQSFVMHYGNSGAANLSSGPAVFSTASGYAAVWHLQDTTEVLGKLPLTGSAKPTTKFSGVIDSAYSFNGSTMFFKTADSTSVNSTSLNFPATTSFTLSGWERDTSAALGGVDRMIVSKGGSTWNLGERGASNSDYEMMSAMNGAWVWDTTLVRPTLGTWHHIVGVRSVTQGTSPVYAESLYVDGIFSMPPSGAINAGAVTAVTTRAVDIGTQPDNPTDLWKGQLEEVEISNVARTHDWVKLSYQNQQANQTLLAFAALPSIPTLASPANNATGQPTALTLNWNSVSGALTYEVQVATAAGFGVATVSDQAGLTGVSATVAGLAGSTTYYWQVNATNGAGTTAWSAAWSFTTTIGSPALSSPANGATGQPVTLSLSWGSVSGAVSYGVQVSTDMSFGSTVSGQTGLTGLYGVVTSLTGGVTYYWEANATGAAATGAWSGVWSFSAGMTQVIPLNTAWNMKSLNVIPLQDTTTMVFGTDPGGFLFVKDNAGDVYCPAAYQDNINYVQVGQGYQVYTTVPDTMEVMGIPVNYAATAIALSSGWNTIAYLPPSDDSIEHALAGIDTLLIIVKNNSGHAYWPSLGIDDIGIMYVGEGYKVLMSSAASLTYPTPDTGVAKRVAARGGKTMLRLPEPRHYATHANTGNNATLLAKRVTIGDKAVPDSSEIGAFDGTGSLVGSGTVMHGIAAFAVWGIDPQGKTKKKDGCAVSESVTFRLWDGKREYPLDYVTQNGTPAKYGVDKVFLGVLSVPEGYLITKFDLTRAYPNPFRGSVKIAFDVPTIGGVTQHVIELAVYDLKGSLVKQLASGIYRAGHYALSWNSGEGRESAVGSSVYIVRMKAANFDKRLKLVRIQ